MHSAVSAFSSIPAPLWDGCFPGEVEGLRYYQACEASHPSHAHTQALVVKSPHGADAVAPMFRMDYALHTSLQEGRLGDALRWLDQRFPRALKLPLLGLGSPFAERCHFGFAPEASVPDRQEAAGRMLDLLEQQAALSGIGLTVVKDVHDTDLPVLEPVLRERGYTRLSSLPVAVLHLRYPTFDAYLDSLSGATRKDMRRKLRAAEAVEIEIRTDVSDIQDELYALYEETRLTSASDYGDFERLPRDYFHQVVSSLSPQAFCVLYRVEGVLAAFNLLMVEDDRVIDKFLGMRYPLARTHNLYFVSWMQNVRYCIANGKTRLQTGQGTFSNKLRLGSSLEPMHNYFCHRNPVLNGALKWASKYFGFEEMDPGLREARKRAGELSPL
ncbi:GNAT family N-acetyltransferase [Ancylobacter sp.]|uniref:GNAT family N-acetyltransferase n=1 Tax=Ancylobacter sp. TaxID=1872567 RepID=UPI003C7E28D3